MSNYDKFKIDQFILYLDANFTVNTCQKVILNEDEWTVEKILELEDEGGKATYLMLI